MNFVIWSRTTNENCVTCALFNIYLSMRAELGTRVLGPGLKSDSILLDSDSIPGPAQLDSDST